MMQIASIRQIELLAMLALAPRRTLHRQTQEFELPLLQAPLPRPKKMSAATEEGPDSPTGRPNCVDTCNESAHLSSPKFTSQTGRQLRAPADLGNPALVAMARKGMRISTIVLNWNRQALLEQTLRSYAATVAEPFELIVVDNASSDGSREVIEHCRAEIGNLQTIFSDENLGGEAINLALEQVTGDLVHITENDQVFIDGWSQHVRDCFAAFTGLGQLSLHGAVPTDDEAWELKPSHLRFSKGKVVYEAHGNVETASVIPARVFCPGGVRVHNIPQNGAGVFKFPDDARLSADIKNLDLWCAWSDRYYVRNLGHEVSEFGRDPDYYRQNYESKPWLGVEGWKRRLDAVRDRPRFPRRSMVFPTETLQPEKTPGKIAGKSAQLWSMFDGNTAETEVLDFLYALVRLVKPENAVETGTWLGRSAVAIGSALRDNGFGHLISLESDSEVARCAMAQLRAAGLDEWVDIITEQNLNFQPRNELQFALLDSDVRDRAEEFRHFYEKLAAGATVVFHDTGVQHEGLADAIRELIAQGQLAGAFFPTPRGIFAGSVRRPPELPATTPLELSLKNQDLSAQSLPCKRAAILVLGVHRSGTSSLAHLLNMLGAKLPEKVMAPAHSNPLGHWEPVRLMEINEEILSAIGRSWHDPRPIPPNWFRSKEAYAFHERLAAAIASGYGIAPLILIKEPRICRLAPLYLDVLDVLGIKPLVILPVRHPEEVIRSIDERDQIDPRTIELLWLRSLLEAEEASRACARVWTSFERLLDNWDTTAQSIADRLGIVWPNKLEKVATEVADVLRPRHRHHRFADDPAPLPLSSLTTRAWEAAQHALNGDEAAARAAFDEIRTSLTEVDRLNGPQRESIERRLGTAEADRERLIQQLQERDAQISQLQAELSERLGQIDSIHASICWRLTWPIRWLHKLLRRCRPQS
jgi:predicted O-methyltransferase YrrM